VNFHDDASEAAREITPVDIVADLRSWCSDTHTPSDSPDRLLCGAADAIETLRTMIDHPEVLAMLAGPGGSTCAKVIGDNESEWFRRHWRNALDQWGWWRRRYEAATGDSRGRIQIEMEERRNA
jgi:hypothetical protein